MNDALWLFVALLAVWVGLGLYALTVAVRQRRLEQRLRELENRR